jgi:hypothetical protein
MKLTKVLLVTAGLLFCPLLKAATYHISIKIDTGFFERKNALIKAEVNFGKAIDAKSIKLIKEGKKIPILFMPQKKYNAEIYWILQGETPSLTTKEYTLKFADGAWDTTPIGSAELQQRVQNETNIAPNHSFEIVTEKAKKKTNWKGTKLPTGWALADFGWSHRKLPDITATCRIAETEAYDGQKSLEFKSQLRDDKKNKNGRKLNLIGFAISPVFPLKPDTEYSFSYQVKFVDIINNDGNHQGMSASVNFLGKDKKRIYPRNYAINRLQVAYSTARNPKAAYFKKWHKVEYRKKTPPEVRFGQIWISGSLTGQVYIDNLILKECGKGGKPVKVKVGR